MKKFVMSIAALSLIFCASSCSSKDAGATDSESAVADTTIVAPQEDSVAAPAEEVAEEVVPTEVLTLVQGKKNLKYADEASFKTGTLQVNITNNGKVPVKGSDYKVSYKEDAEVYTDDGIDDKTFTRRVDGVDVAPGETVTITIKSGEGCQDLKNPKIINAN